jgi:hypothetical protein
MRDRRSPAEIQVRSKWYRVNLSARRFSPEPSSRNCVPMDVRQLKYFIAIVDAGSLSKASQKLYVAQPSLPRASVSHTPKYDLQKRAGFRCPVPAAITPANGARALG